MLQVSVRQMLGVFLAALMLRPFPMLAAPTAAVLGSISSYGAVTVGDLAAPAENTLFAGDLVKTASGSAVIQYNQGARVLLAVNSSAQFTAAEVQLQEGQMTFRSVSDHGPVFNASSLRLEPIAANSSADVTLRDGKALVTVREGAVRVKDPTGVPLISMQAGQTQLFAKAVTAAPAAPARASASPATAAAAPQLFGNPTLMWVVLGAVAASVATVVAISVTNDEVDGGVPVSPSTP